MSEARPQEYLEHLAAINHLLTQPTTTMDTIKEAFNLYDSYMLTQVRLGWETRAETKGEAEETLIQATMALSVAEAEIGVVLTELERVTYTQTDKLTVKALVNKLMTVDVGDHSQEAEAFTFNHRTHGTTKLLSIKTSTEGKIARQNHQINQIGSTLPLLVLENFLLGVSCVFFL